MEYESNLDRLSSENEDNIYYLRLKHLFKTYINHNYEENKKIESKIEDLMTRDAMNKDIDLSSIELLNGKIVVFLASFKD